VIFSLIIDKIGYGKAMVFAFVCHVLSIAITVSVPYLVPKDDPAKRTEIAFWVFYLGNFIVALGNGTVEAVINPVVATLFSREKTKWLNILHAGWPGGLVVGGIMMLALDPEGLGKNVGWQLKIGLLGLPVILYGIILFGCKFPVSERVSAGVSFRDMLKEVGFLGALVVSSLIVIEVSNVLTKLGYIFQPAADGTKPWAEVVKSFDTPFLASIGMEKIDITKELAYKLGTIGAISLVFGLYTLSLGRFMFVFLLLIMMPLAITELGTDSWISDLMEPEMKNLGLKGGYVLVYTSFIMMVLRFCAGPIVHAISPLGLLAVSAAIAAVGLFSLSMTTGVVLLVAATAYGFGKTFFWPTMLGVVAERFPKGGAMTLNTISGVGMLAVGILGNPLLGNIQDKTTDRDLKTKDAGIHAKVVDEPRSSVFGTYQPVNENKVKTLEESDQKIVTDIKDASKKNALSTVAIFPIVMLVCYLILIGIFAMRGGYKAETIGDGSGGGH
jgi:fucose permease